MNAHFAVYLILRGGGSTAKGAKKNTLPNVNTFRLLYEFVFKKLAFEFFSSSDSIGQMQRERIQRKKSNG